MPSKRAPGGGRKPAGPISGKLSNFSTRITQETRAALDAEAKAAGQSVSQIAERLIRAGLAAEREHDRPIRALCFVIAELASNIVGPRLKHSDHALYDWRSDPFFYRAFKIAVGQLLDALEPPGPIKAYKVTAEEADHPSIKRYLESFKTPEARAEDSVDYILAALSQAPRQTAEQREEQRKLAELHPSSMREFYGMPDAARDLAIKPRSGKTTPMALSIDPVFFWGNEPKERKP
jgi:hypothetical protein